MKPAPQLWYSRIFWTIVALTLLVNTVFVQRVRNRAVSTSSASARFPSTNFNDGDLVLRKGRGVISDLFRSASVRDRSYSHAGLYFRLHHSDCVVHIQQDQPGPSLVVEPLSRFWDVATCEAGAVYRVSGMDESDLRRIREAVMTDLKKGLEFDAEFSIETTDRNYCTEWIWRKFEAVCPGSDFFSISKAGDFYYIAPDDLYSRSDSRLVYHFKNEMQ